MPRVVMANRHEGECAVTIGLEIIILFGTEFDRSILNEMGELGILGPTIKGICQVLVP